MYRGIQTDRSLYLDQCSMSMENKLDQIKAEMSFLKGQLLKNPKQENKKSCKNFLDESQFKENLDSINIYSQQKTDQKDGFKPQKSNIVYLLGDKSDDCTEEEINNPIDILKQQLKKEQKSRIQLEELVIDSNQQIKQLKDQVFSLQHDQKQNYNNERLSSLKRDNNFTLSKNDQNFSPEFMNDKELFGGYLAPEWQDYTTPLPPTYPKSVNKTSVNCGTQTNFESESQFYEQSQLIKQIQTLKQNKNDLLLTLESVLKIIRAGSNQNKQQKQNLQQIQKQYTNFKQFHANFKHEMNSLQQEMNKVCDENDKQIINQTLDELSQDKEESLQQIQEDSIQQIIQIKEFEETTHLKSFYDNLTETLEFLKNNDMSDRSPVQIWDNNFDALIN